MIYSKQVVKELCVAGGHLRQKEPPLGSTKQYWKKEKREKKNHIHVYVSSNGLNRKLL